MTPPPDGGGGTGATLDEIVAAVAALLDGRGWTAGLAEVVQLNLDAKVSTRSTYAGGPVESVTTPVDVNLDQVIPDSQQGTVGGSLAAAWSVGWGRVSLDRATRRLYVWGPGNASETVASKAFLVDSATSPLSRR